MRGVTGASALGAIALSGLAGAPRTSAASISRPAASVWVWQFDRDASAITIRSHLAGRGVGVIVKTHDGTSWMSRWDKTPEAVFGPLQVRRLATFFAMRRVHFSAWCVPRGIDPIAEASMAADVLEAGAKSLYLDLEPPEGRNYWQTGPAEAVAFGRELRRLRPDAHLVVAPDARPGQAARVPMAEFASFCDEIAPQAYWRLFDTPANHRKLAEAGFDAGPVTPEFVVDVSMKTFQAYGKPLSPIGQGDASGDDWQRFLDVAAAQGSHAVSVWRYGNAGPAVWDAISASRTPDVQPGTGPDENALPGQAAQGRGSGVPSTDGRDAWMRTQRGRRGAWR